jgi:dipeptidase E
MRLYLSSMVLGDHPEQLVDLAGAGARLAVIMNALDNFPDQRERYFGVSQQEFEALGFGVEELDLRAYFGTPERLAPVLERTDVVWVNGGNTFLLRRAMALSGFDSLVRPLLSADRLVYGGFSAGVCVATPSLRGIEFLDDPLELAEGYPRQPIWEGLGLIDYHVAVHYRPGPPDVEPIQRTVRYFREHGMPYVALRDGEVIVVRGNESELIR